jgi:hypothetical protein
MVTLPSTSEKVKRLRRTPTVQRPRPQARLDRDRGFCPHSERLPLEEAHELRQRLKNLGVVLQPELVKVLHIGTPEASAIVQWQPPTQNSRESYVAAFIADREARAAAQVGVMSFYPLANREGAYTVVNDDLHGDGPYFLYLDSPAECDCKDYSIRCLQAQRLHGRPFECHHIIGLRCWLEKQRRQQEREMRRTHVRPECRLLAGMDAAQRRTWFLRQRDLDFPQYGGIQ